MRHLLSTIRPPRPLIGCSNRWGGHMRILLVSTLVFSGCFYTGKPPKPHGCHDNGDCHAGTVCLSNDCRQLCTVQADCPSGDICGTDDVCVEPKDGPLPTLDS